MADEKHDNHKVDSLGRVRPVKYRKLYDSERMTDGSRTEENTSIMSLDNCDRTSHKLYNSESLTDGSQTQDQSSIMSLDNCDRTSANESLDFAMLLNEYIQHHDLINSEDTKDSSNNDDDHDDWYSSLYGDVEEPGDDDISDFDNSTSNNSEFSLDDEKLLNDPVTLGHSMPLKVSVLLIWLFVMTHSLSGTIMTDLLFLLNLHMYTPNIAFKSLYRFKRLFANLKSPYVKHYYCNFCQTAVEDNMEICPNGFCLKDLSFSKAKSYFIEIPIASQLQNLFKQENFVNSLQHRFKRKKRCSSNIEDIYDGHLYKRLSDGDGPLSDKFPYNISFILNTDGVPLFKSSKMSIWPLFLMINELPYKLRKQRSKMLIAGLWVGDTKPFMGSFTQPLHKSLKILETTGIDINISGHNETCKAFLIGLCADLPAKSSILNMLQFNGQYSCSTCLQKGENFRTETGGNVHIFKYDVENPTGPGRTPEGVCIDAKKCYTDNTVSVNGIKGPSFLMYLKSFDYVRSSSIDYMHCILLGINKLLLKLWFTSAHAKEVFSLYSVLQTVDTRLKQIKPPHTVTRLPRSISEHVKYWKASELRSWFFFYSVPILSDLMLPIYFYHYLAFLEAVYIMCQSSIDETDLMKCNNILQYFVYMFGNLYGERYLTLNVHSLLHLPQKVKDLGPLWCHSCFPFENLNGELLQLFHGTQFVDTQIINAVNVLQVLPRLTQLLPDKPETKEINDFVKYLQNRNCHTRRNNNTKRSNNVNFLGKGFFQNITEQASISVCALLGNRIENIEFFNRVSLNGNLYHCKDYDRCHSRNSYTVKYTDLNNCVQYGVVIWYAKHTDQSGKVIEICLINKLLHARSTNLVEDIGGDNFLNLSLKHICIVRECSLSFDIVPIQNIVDLCVSVRINDLLFICHQPNHKEINV